MDSLEWRTSQTSDNQDTWKTKQVSPSQASKESIRDSRSPVYKTRGLSGQKKYWSHPWSDLRWTVRVWGIKIYLLSPAVLDTPDDIQPEHRRLRSTVIHNSPPAFPSSPPQVPTTAPRHLCPQSPYSTVLIFHPINSQIEKKLQTASSAKQGSLGPLVCHCVRSQQAHSRYCGQVPGRRGTLDRRSHPVLTKQWKVVGGVSILILPAPPRLLEFVTGQEGTTEQWKSWVKVKHKNQEKHLILWTKSRLTAGLTPSLASIVSFLPAFLGMQVHQRQVPSISANLGTPPPSPFEEQSCWTHKWVWRDFSSAWHSPSLFVWCPKAGRM